jgi:hypothetical protein
VSAAPPRVPLFDRLPEIYRTRDGEQAPADQLRAYLRAIEIPFGALHAHISQLYDDLFIDTCADWVIPYLADLLGTTHLQGDPHTLRADVADTIALRRRKGTLGAIEQLAENLTAWACRSVELRENLGWSQHLNHQRADAGGLPPHAAPTLTRFDVARGGTAPLRDPADLALLGTPFDSFAYTADFKAPIDDVRHINLPNLAIFLWRLAAYQLPLTVPLAKGFTDLGAQSPGLAGFALRFDLHPLDLPVRLFNTSRGLLSAGAPGTVAPLTAPDAVPGPLLDARLAGHPGAYVEIDFYEDAAPPHVGFDLGEVGLHLFLPESLRPLLVSQIPGAEWRWRFRGDNLCAWEAGLRRPLASAEIAIDPELGRVVMGLDTRAQVDALMTAEGGGFLPHIYTSFTYAAPGPVGAHPVTRVTAAAQSTEIEMRTVGTLSGGSTLQAALEDLNTGTLPVVINIIDSLVHRIDISALPGTSVDGGFSLRLARSLTIRAADEHRPIVLLATPLAFRVLSAAEATVKTPVVRLEGLYLAPDEAAFPPDTALITRAAVARLELIGCTLFPGGHAGRDGIRAAGQLGMNLENGYGFEEGDIQLFEPTPDIIVQRCITGALAIDDRYRLDVQDTIVDGGPEVGGPSESPFGIGATGGDPSTAWGPRLDFSGLTCFGRVRVSGVGGQGGIFTRRFEVLDNQHGCIKWSWFSGADDRLPPNHFCLRAPGARLAFTSEWFNEPGYGQIARGSDVRIRTLGPDDDAMGAFGFLFEEHKWINLQVRLREFMPVGVRPLIVPVT